MLTITTPLFREAVEAALNAAQSGGSLPHDLTCTLQERPTALPMAMFGGPPGKGWRISLETYDRVGSIAVYSVEELPF